MLLMRALPAFAAAAVVAGCALGSSGAAADDARALQAPTTQAASAVGTAAIAVELLADGQTFATVTDTALLDQVHVLADAVDAIATLVPVGSDGAGWQADALAATRDAQAAVVAARAWANGADVEVGTVDAALDESADRLDALTATLEAAGAS